MKKIATLGPAGTFTEIAAKKYQQLINEELEIKLYPTIPKSCEAIGKECEWGIIPIENTLDGYVQRSLDILLGIEFKIVHELFLPIQFSFVSNEKNLNNLQRIYAQFKSQGQCMKFLDQFESRKIITTASNGISFERMNNLIPGEAAILHMLLIMLQIMIRMKPDL